MTNTYRTDAGIKAGDWEYLGTVRRDGVEYVALRPLDGTSRVCFFSFEAGTYSRIVDSDTIREVNYRFRRASVEQFGSWLPPALEAR